MQHVNYLAQIAGVPNPRRMSVRTRPSETHAERVKQAELVADYCARVYKSSTDTIADAFEKFLAGPYAEDFDKQAKHVFKKICNACYPFIGVEKRLIAQISRRRLEAQPGGPDRAEKQTEEAIFSDPFLPTLRESHDYGSTIAEPEVLREYLIAQVMRLLKEQYQVEVGLSIVPVPVLFAVERNSIKQNERAKPEIVGRLRQFFPMPNITDVEDCIIDGTSRLRDDSATVNIDYQLFSSEFWKQYFGYLRNKEWRTKECESAMPAALKTKHAELLASGLFDAIDENEREEHDREDEETSRSTGYRFQFPRPLTFFDGLRTDFSIHRIRHYTHTSPQHFQDYVLFTNYKKYVRRFVLHACAEIWRTRGEAKLVVPPPNLPAGRGKHVSAKEKEICFDNLAKCFGKKMDLFHKWADPNKWRALSPKERDDSRDALYTQIDKFLGHPDAQMPAYHFIPNLGQAQQGGQGNKEQLDRLPIVGTTLINIGVGPSNARTMSDHVAVLRPLCWIMLGHCAGVRFRQELGDYVLADSYAREDGVLDPEVAPSNSFPASREINAAIFKALTDAYWQEEGRTADAGAMSVEDDGIPAMGDGREETEHLGLIDPIALNPEARQRLQLLRALKRKIREGKVLSTSNRNWEFSPTDQIFDFLETNRIVAVDMESATLAANAYRCRVPHGTFLCVSDRPLHGEVKMRYFADHFYRTQVDHHLDIALNALKRLHFHLVSKVRLMNTRALRGSEDPPWR